MQTFPKTKRVEPVQPVKMNAYQSNTYRKDLTWLCFGNEPRVQERQQRKDQKPCTLVFVTYQAIPSSN